VWVIYLGDRLLDVRWSQLDPGEQPARHAWARRHGGILVACLALAMVIGVAIIPRLDPATLRAGIVVALATGLYFLLFRWSIGARVRPSVLPAKEIAIAGCFTAGAAIAAAPRDLGDLPVVDLAGLACLILGNCLLISRRESARDAREDPAAFFADGKKARLLPEMALSAGLGLGAWSWWQIGISPTSLALILCAALTLFLARTRSPVLTRHTQALADGLHLLVWLVAFLF
jgi:hypothetical protein